jgi:hypothetical protein
VGVKVMASKEQRRRQWEKRIARWRGSGLSMAAYCREHEVNYAQLVWWRRHLQRDAAAQPLTLILYRLALSGHGFATQAALRMA